MPSHLHHEIASAALAAGKHLLLEKPMALSLRECDDLIRLAREHNRVFAVGHELRLSSLWGKVKELIADGFVGEPQYVLIELSRRPYRQGSENWRYDIQPRRQLDSRGADPFLRPGPLVFERRSAIRKPCTPRPIRVSPAIPS